MYSFNGLCFAEGTFRLFVVYTCMYIQAFYHPVHMYITFVLWTSIP